MSEKVMRAARLPAGWDEARVRQVLEHYEQQSDEEAVAEDELLPAQCDQGVDAGGAPGGDVAGG